MADLALITANKLEVVESIEQATLPTDEVCSPGQVVRINTSTGKFTKANATSVAEGSAYGIVVGGVANVAGQPVTAIHRGVLDGYDLSGLNYWQKVYLSLTDGALSDADPGAYGDTKVVARVIPGTSVTNGTAYDKLLLVDFPLIDL